MSGRSRRFWYAPTPKRFDLRAFAGGQDGCAGCDAAVMRPSAPRSRADTAVASGSWRDRSRPDTAGDGGLQPATAAACRSPLPHEGQPALAVVGRCTRWHRSTLQPRVLAISLPPWMRSATARRAAAAPAVMLFGNIPRDAWGICASLPWKPQALQAPMAGAPAARTKGERLAPSGNAPVQTRSTPS